MRYICFLLIMLFSIGVNAAEKAVNCIPVNKIPYVRYNQKPGWEERGVEFTRWLSCSVRIPSSGGSGTMVYYDDYNKYMYVLSAGHLFPAGRFRMSKKANETAEIHVFYQGNKKLSHVKAYRGELLCSVWNTSVYDVSLIRFKPDWPDPYYIPIAPLDTKIQKGGWYHSAGCDGMGEVAHYLVQMQGERSDGAVTEYVTGNNAPRGGRSGGGLFTNDSLIGICSRGGGNTGLWSSLQQIHKFLNEEGYGFILQGYAPARRLVIVDRNMPQGKYSKNFIPVPMGQSVFGIKLPR